MRVPLVAVLLLVAAQSTPAQEPGRGMTVLTRQSQNQKPWSRPLLVVVVVIEYPRDNDNDNDNEISSTACSRFAE
jgi:hypothetical protein